MYRDGMGGPTLIEKVLKHEVKFVVDYLESYSQSYKPSIIYCLVNRNISHRLFAKDNNELLNPCNGTVVDTSLVEN